MRKLDIIIDGKSNGSNDTSKNPDAAAPELSDLSPDTIAETFNKLTETYRKIIDPLRPVFAKLHQVIGALHEGGVQDIDLAPVTYERLQALNLSCNSLTAPYLFLTIQDGLFLIRANKDESFDLHFGNINKPRASVELIDTAYFWNRDEDNAPPEYHYNIHEEEDMLSFAMTVLQSVALRKATSEILPAADRINSKSKPSL